MDEGTGNRTLKVEIDGEEKEVTIPDGWFSETEVHEHYVPKEQFRKELSKQAQKAREGYVKRDELLADEDFIAEVAETRRDELLHALGVETGKQEPDGKALEKIRAKLERELAEPLKEQLAKTTQERDKLRSDSLDAQIERAMRGTGIEDEVVDLVPLYLKQRASYDEEHGWVVLDEDGELDWVTKDGKPKPKRVADLLAEIKQSGKKPGWFKSEMRSGVGYEGTDRSGRVPDKKVKDMSDKERQDWIDAHSAEAWGRKVYEEAMADQRKP